MNYNDLFKRLYDNMTVDELQEFYNHIEEFQGWHWCDDARNEKSQDRYNQVYDDLESLIIDIKKERNAK
jgi:hypothetical protein